VHAGEIEAEFVTATFLVTIAGSGEAKLKQAVRRSSGLTAIISVLPRDFGPSAH
jgi:hypothetical protein